MKPRTILVLGPSGGLGSAVVETLMASDPFVSIVGLGRTESANCSQFIHCDLSLHDSVEIACQEVRALEEVSGFVNCAGTALGGLFIRATSTDIQAHFQENYLGPFKIFQTLARKMSRQGHGSMVHVSSILVDRRQEGTAVYSSIRAAMDQALAVLSAETARYGVRVNVVRPGPIRTKMLEEMSSKSLANLLSLSLQGRAALPLEVAKVVEFLLDNKLSGHVTGEVLRVSGGWR